MNGLMMTEGPGHEVVAGRLSGRVYSALKTRLVEGDFPAGKRIGIEALRQEYGVSKQPVMEAFRLLASDGIVEIVPQVGCRPMDYSIEEVADFFRVFAASEGAVAAAAATRCTPEQIAGLRTALRETADLDQEPDPKIRGRLYRLANRRFHTRIQEMAASRVIDSVSRRMWDLSDYLVNTFPEGGSFSAHTAERHTDHERIVQALAHGDASMARIEMSNHILHTVRRLGLD